MQLGAGPKLDRSQMFVKKTLYFFPFCSGNSIGQSHLGLKKLPEVWDRCANNEAFPSLLLPFFNGMVGHGAQLVA